MKKFIGKRVEFLMEGIDKPFQAVVRDETKEFILVQGERDEFVRWLVKSKVVMFMPLEHVAEDTVNLLVLYCENPSIGCPGVQFIKEGKGFSQGDFKGFTSPCPSKCGTCRFGSRGELRSVSGAILGPMLNGMMFGDYPEASDE